MAIRRFEVTAVTASDGSKTAYSPYLSGYIHAIEYVKTDYADGVDFTITAEATGETIWAESNVNAAKVCLPRAATHSTAGVAALYAAGGTAINDRIALGADRVKIVIASGGDTKTGEFIIIVDDTRLV
jgi:hypothetical protein